MRRLCRVIAFLAVGIPAGLSFADRAAQAAPVNLVINGGFETGTLAGWTFEGHEGGRFYSGSGTTVSGGPVSPHGGAYAAQINVQNIIGQSLSQTLTTLPGQTYEVTFWRRYAVTDPVHEVGYLFLNWDAQNIHFESYLPSTGSDWAEFTAYVTGTGSDLLSFYYIEGPPNYLALDDISVTALTVPEPAAAPLLALALAGLIGGRAWMRREKMAKRP